MFVKSDPGALYFPGVMGGPLRRGNFNRMSARPQAVWAIGAEGLHFHDLRHTGNTFAASSGAALRDLMAGWGTPTMMASLGRSSRLASSPLIARAPPWPKTSKAQSPDHRCLRIIARAGPSWWSG